VVNNLLGSITSILGTGSPAASIVNTVPVVSGVLGGLTGTATGAGLPSVLPTGILTNLPAVNTLLTGTVGNLLTTLQSTLSGLLNQVLGILGNLPLLKLDGAQVGVATKAAPALADSLANVTAQLGHLSVLGVQLPGVDLASIGSLLTGITNTLGGALSIINPALANLVKVGVLDKTTNVAASDGYNRARAGLSILNVSIVPPLNLGGILSGITGGSGASAASLRSKAVTGTPSVSNNPLALLGNLGVADPAGSLPVLGGLGAGMLGLDNLLNIPAAVGALASGLSLQVGQILSASDYTSISPQATPGNPATPVAAPNATLPRTGGETGALAAVAAVLAALALGIRRTVRRPVRAGNSTTV
jgi:hypothetical protein